MNPNNSLTYLPTLYSSSNLLHSPSKQSLNISLSNENISRTSSYIQSPTNQSPINNKPIFNDDIECESWLNEINLTQYTETFLTNCSLASSNSLLSRKRLNEIRLQDFSKMNITNYLHQKLLIEHIRNTLLFAYNSDLRRNNVKEYKTIQLLNSTSTDTILSANSSIQLPKQLASLTIDINKRNSIKNKPIDSKRRKTFDQKIWKSIEKSRKDEFSINTTVENLREGKFDTPESTKSQSKRRHTYDLNDKIITAQEYGNLALEYDKILNELKLLQHEQLNYYKSIINCEISNILFYNMKRRELMIYIDNQWLKFSVDTGIAGYCILTGESLNIKDAYADSRFNRAVDKKTGFKTNTILCQPIYSNRSGGTIVGVVQMLNKKDSLYFNDEDERALAACVDKIADSLNDKFQDLLIVSEKFNGQATEIKSQDRKSNIYDNTIASKGRITKKPSSDDTNGN